MTLVVNQELPTVRRAAQIAALLRQRYGKDRVAAVVSRYDARADIGQEDIERVVGLPGVGRAAERLPAALCGGQCGRPLVSRRTTAVWPRPCGSSPRELAPARHRPAAAPRSATG